VSLCRHGLRDIFTAEWPASLLFEDIRKPVVQVVDMLIEALQLDELKSVLESRLSFSKAAKATASRTFRLVRAKYHVSALRMLTYPHSL
jgi:hypothetical protein